MSKLFDEIKDIVLKNPKGITPEKIRQMSVITSQASRITLALREMEQRGILYVNDNLIVTIGERNSYEDQERLRGELLYKR